MLTSAREFTRLIIERFDATLCLQVAGSLTYTTLLALVPLLTVMLSLFSNFPAFGELGEALSEFLQANVLPARAGEIVTTYALQFSEKAAQLTLVGTATLVVTVLMLLSTIDGVFNDIWGVRDPKSLLKRMGVYWVVLTLGPFALAGSVYALSKLVAGSSQIVGESFSIIVLSGVLAPVALLTALFAFLYYAVPNHPVKAMHALLSGFFTALAFILTQRVFGAFIVNFPNYTLIYGTFAALPIFLAWLYASWVIVLSGALVAASLPGFFARKHTQPRFAGDEACLAVALLAQLADAQATGKVLAFEALHAGTGATPALAESVLGGLRKAGWVLRTDEECWALATRIDELALSDIVHHFALDPAQWSRIAHPACLHAANRLAAGLRDVDASLAELASPPPVIALPASPSATSPAT